MIVISYLAMFLDTRGYVIYRLERYSQAASDLDKAVQQAERALRMAGNTGRRAAPYKRQLAVMLYHRGLLRQKQQQGAAAKQDFDRIRELGFHPSEALN